jgi:putative transposase
VPVVRCDTQRVLCLAVREGRSTPLENKVLVEQIRVEYKLSRQTYGSPRIWARLRLQGSACGRHRVAHLMRRAGIRLPKRQRRYPVTTQHQPGVIPAPNRLN